MAAAGAGGDELTTLVVDDTLLYRLLVSEAVEHLPGFKVVGKAENGKVGLEKVQELKPQLVLLDLEMPVMDGFEMLSHLKKDHPDIRVVIISSLSKQGGKVTLEALQKGAFDFITKPEQDDASASRAELLEQLRLKLAPLRGGATAKPAAHSPRPAAQARKNIDEVLYGSGKVGGKSSGASTPARPPTATSTKGEVAPPSTSTSDATAAARTGRFDVIGIGISTGGPQALSDLLPQLQPGLPPICIVQHMPGPFLTAMAEKLDTQCSLHVVEGANGDTLQRDTVYIAPGGTQMRINKNGMSGIIELRPDPAENHCLPAADYLLRSLAEEFGRSALGAVLTGMGNDGAKGLLQMKEAGALTLAQNEATCTVYGMPKQAVKLGAAGYELPLNGIAQVFRSAG